jgi:hypothetical protein
MSDAKQKKQLLRGGVLVSMVKNATDTKTRDIRIDEVLTGVRTGGGKLKGQITQIRNRFEAELAITGASAKQLNSLFTV